MHKLVVISMDALVQEDLVKMETMPAFHYLMANGSYVKDFRSIYPTLTYPCHITMSTGCYPNKHGITNNEEVIFEEGKNPYLKWMHYHDKVKCEDIFDVCKKAGLTTASVGWPVSGNHRSVDYLVDETWPSDKASVNDWNAWKESYLKTGTPQWLFDEAVAAHLWQRVGKKQPQSSYFLANVAAEIIKKHSPDIMMIHVGNVDAYRHISGVFSEKVNRTLSDTDAILNILFNAAKETGTFDDTNFVVTSDHGQISYSRFVRPNILFKEKGLIQVDENENLIDWKALCVPVGMSAQIMLRDNRYYDEVYTVLKEASETGMHGFTTVYTAEETNAQEGLNGNFAFVLETDNYSNFAFEWNGKEAESVPMGLYMSAKASHGYHPDKGPRPVFLACGPDIYHGVTVEHAKLVDGAVTYAALMGVELENADGAIIPVIKK